MDVRTLCEDMLSFDVDRLCACLWLSASCLDGFGLRSAFASGVAEWSHDLVCYIVPSMFTALPFNGQLVHMACEGLYEKESPKVNMIYAVSLRPSAYKSCQLDVGYSLLPLGQI